MNGTEAPAARPDTPQGPGKSASGRTYICIDLKSFYASVECVERGLDPFAVNLVVADPDRGRGSICLAVSPAMKALGVPGRCRVYEIPPHIRYITAKPRMGLYLRKSAQIVGIYLRYVSEDDMHVYSVDEVFIDATDYLRLYRTDARAFAERLRRAVFDETGICATAGIGTNLFLAKIALDIVAKHVPDHIGELDEQSYRQKIWFHTPITDIWNVGPGTAARLARLGVYNMYGVTLLPEEVLFRVFGVNARYLIDHAWGRENCTVAQIKAYRPRTSSLSQSQILFRDYRADEARVVMLGMLDTQVLKLVRKNEVAGQVALYLGYSKDCCRPFSGARRLPEGTCSRRRIESYFTDMYDAGVAPQMPIRRIAVTLGELRPAQGYPLSLFSDYGEEEKELRLLRTVAEVHDRFGRSALLRGRDFEPCATLRARNNMIGGHNAGEPR